MKENYKKWGIYGILLICIIFIISFAVGFFSAREDTVSLPEIPVNTVITPSFSPIPESTPIPVSYYLINEVSGVLKLYLVEGESLTEIKSEEISLDVFPHEDVLMLSEGMRFDTSDEALAVWENFIS